eukprot:g15871.t1
MIRKRFVYLPTTISCLLAALFLAHYLRFLAADTAQSDAKNAQAILISIERAAERRQRIYSQNISVRLLNNPVDGIKLADPKSYLSPHAYYDFDKKKHDHRTINTLGAIGCYMSHENAWKEVVDLNKPEFIIEDDITIVNENYMDFVNEWMLSDHSKPRIKWLQYGYLNKGENLLWGTGAYLINPLAAKMLLEHSRPIDVQVDAYMHLMIFKYKWDFEKTEYPIFRQYETSDGAFKTLCQPYTNDHPENKYLM